MSQKGSLISGLKIPRYSVACPRWNVYTAFLYPGKIKIQLSRMLDGSTFICFARTGAENRRLQI